MGAALLLVPGRACFYPYSDGMAVIPLKFMKTPPISRSAGWGNSV